MADREELLGLVETAPEDRARAFAKAHAALSDERVEVRAAAAEAVAATGTPDEAIADLERLGAAREPGVRLAAVAAAAGLPWRNRFSFLREKLKDEDKGIALTAADGLAFAGDASGAELLRGLATEKRWKLDALDALLSIDDPSLEAFSRRTFGSMFGGSFEKAVAAVYLAGKGDEPARTYLRARFSKKRGEERPFILLHLARVDPNEGRAAIETIARASDEYLRESALLALARLDPANWWASAQEAVGRWADEDPHVSAEVLLGLFEIDWTRAGLIANAHVHRETELGGAARRVRLASALRDQFESEVQLRCV